jgi:putative methyltransferase (TIGR04325 family)
MGTAMCPYRLFNRAEFLDEIRGFGYRLVDAWESPDVRCELPFHPEYRIEAYSGFYFSKN